MELTVFGGAQCAATGESISAQRRLTRNTGDCATVVVGKEKTIGLGVFPAVGLAEARAKRDDARRLIAAGIDPSMQRQDRKAATANQC